MKRIALVNKNICVACGVCVKSCPKAALSVYKGCYALVDEAKCVGCGLCGKACPATCIEMMEKGQ